MNPKIKGLLHLVVNLGGNGAIFEFVPAEYRALAFCVFNLIAVSYAFIDPTYTYHQLGKSKKQA